MRISVCIICWNEIDGCRVDIPSLSHDGVHEVFAIDGGSTDGTREYLESKGIPVYLQTKKGLNAAYIDANNIAKGDAVVAFFPKATISPSCIQTISIKLREGYDLVIASRQIQGSRNEEDSQFLRPRKWAVKGLACLAALVWCRNGPWIRDVLHGVKGWQKSAFNRMDILQTGLSIDIEMVSRSYKLRQSRCEIPVQEVSRIGGQTHFSFWKTGRRLLRYLVYEILRG